MPVFLDWQICLNSYYLLDERELEPDELELEPELLDDEPELLPIDEEEPLDEELPTDEDDVELLLLLEEELGGVYDDPLLLPFDEELELGLTLLSVVVDLVLGCVVLGRTDLSGEVVVLPCDLEDVPLSVVLVPRLIMLLFSLALVDLSDTLRDEVPLCTVPLLFVLLVLSDTLREEVPRVVPSLFLEETLEPVTILPLLSLLTLRVTELFVLRSVDLLLERESYSPRLVERTDSYVEREVYPLPIPPP
jgi:hypothetical protein